jgi:hypothetical protein
VFFTKIYDIKFNLKSIHISEDQDPNPIGSGSEKLLRGNDGFADIINLKMGKFNTYQNTIQHCTENLIIFISKFRWIISSESKKSIISAGS